VRTTTKAKIGIAGLGAVMLSLVASVPAFADYEPNANDVVGVGGDTPQFALQFAADGSNAGDPGYNATGNAYKFITFNATADGNARQAYAQGSTENAPVPLNPTDVLRAGTVPVQRTQSSGDAIKALLADTGTPETINFIFSASLPSTANQSAAASAGWGFLHVVKIATDSVGIAAATSTHAPAGGLSAAELLSIYTGAVTKWNQLPGNSGGSSDTIIPLLPPSGSSIYKTFIADLTTANGNNAPTISGVQTVEQNDPTAVTGASNPADAIVPFSAGRLALWNNKYFHSPSVVFPGSGTALTAGVTLLSGTPTDSTAQNPTTAYSSPINDYVIFRQSDTTDAPWQPGSTKNWANELFIGSRPFFNTGPATAAIADSGVTPAYADLGNVHS
jgi:ABC-type phosphate transport system substrate-binding protein